MRRRVALVLFLLAAVQAAGDTANQGADHIGRPWKIDVSKLKPRSEADSGVDTLGKPWMLRPRSDIDTREPAAIPLDTSKFSPEANTRGLIGRLDLDDRLRISKIIKSLDSVYCQYSDFITGLDNLEVSRNPSYSTELRVHHVIEPITTILKGFRDDCLYFKHTSVIAMNHQADLQPCAVLAGIIMWRNIEESKLDRACAIAVEGEYITTREAAYVTEARLFNKDVGLLLRDLNPLHCRCQDAFDMAIEWLPVCESADEK